MVDGLETGFRRCATILHISTAYMRYDTWLETGLSHPEDRALAQLLESAPLGGVRFAPRYTGGDAVGLVVKVDGPLSRDALDRLAELVAAAESIAAMGIMR